MNNILTILACVRDVSFNVQSIYINIGNCAGSFIKHVYTYARHFFPPKEFPRDYQTNPFVRSFGSLYIYIPKRFVDCS